MCTQNLTGTPRDIISVPAARARVAHDSSKYPVAPGRDIYPVDPEDPSDLSGLLLGARYRLVRPLGRRVTLYQARRTSLGDPLLVRVLLGLEVGDAMQRFLADAQAACHLHHGHIVRVIDFGIDMLPDGRSAGYLVMEPLKGENLTSTLAKQGPLHWTRVLTIAKQICRALIAAQDRGIIHGDLRLTNCLRISRPGAPDFIKVLDFGISAGWANPGEPGDDLHALAVLMYRLLTGRMPGARPSLRHDIPALGIAPGLADLVTAMLAASPAARPSSGRALYRALVAVEPEPLAAPASIAEVAPMSRRPPPLWAAPPNLRPRAAQPLLGPTASAPRFVAPPPGAAVSHYRWAIASERDLGTSSRILPMPEWTMPWSDWTFWIPLGVMATMIIHAALRTL